MILNNNENDSKQLFIKHLYEFIIYVNNEQIIEELDKFISFDKTPNIGITYNKTIISFVDKSSLDEKIKDKVNEYSMTIAKKLQELGYRGILGIDYLLCDKDQLVFMEINPRFQSSSFLISLYLQKKYAKSIADLHYAAITDQNLPLDLEMEIKDSYLNCNQQTEFKKLLHFKTIENGYFKENPSSNYRKIFARSILLEYDFEKLEKGGII